MAQSEFDGFGVGIETRIAQLQGVPARQRFEIVRQRFLRRQDGAVDQNRYHRDVAGERGGEFDTYVVVRAVEPALAFVIVGVEPIGADDGQHHVALRDLDVELFDEVEPRLHGVDVHEHGVRAKGPAQVVGQAPGQPA